MTEPAPRSVRSGDERRFLTFRVAGRLYALPGDEVSEIILIPPVARLPHEGDAPELEIPPSPTADRKPHSKRRGSASASKVGRRPDRLGRR